MSEILVIETTAILEFLRQEIDLHFEQNGSLGGHFPKEVVPHSGWLYRDHHKGFLHALNSDLKGLLNQIEGRKGVHE